VKVKKLTASKTNEFIKYGGYKSERKKNLVAI
jgi:hypothetical protein